MGCKGLTSTTALPDAEILSHYSIVSTISSSIWLFFSMLSIVWSSDRYSHRWPMMSSPRPFCDCILNIELQVLRIHPCTTHFQTCNTLMHISASRGRKQANFTAKKWVKKPRFQDTPLNYMHSQKTSAWTQDFFLHFSYLKDYQENLPVGLFFGIQSLQERDVPYSYFCSVPTSWEVLPPPFTYWKPDLLTAICKVFKQNRELSPTEISRTHFLLSFCTSFFLSPYPHFRRYTDIGIPPKKIFFSWETMKISKGWEQKDLRPLPCFCSFLFADWRQGASYTLQEHRDGAENQSTGERNTISVPSEALRMKYSNRVTIK